MVEVRSAHEIRSPLDGRRAVGLDIVVDIRTV